MLRAVGVGLLQRGEQATLRARLGAGVQLTQLQKVQILRHVFLGQDGNHQPLLQVAAALVDRTSDVRFRKSHLVGSTVGGQQGQASPTAQAKNLVFPVEHNISSHNNRLHKKTRLPRSHLRNSVYQASKNKEQ